MTTTPGDLLDLAFHDAGIIGEGQVASGPQINAALIRMNQMMAQWTVKRWLVFHLVQVTLTSTGANPYTIGPGGDFNVTQRPDNISAAFFRQLVSSAPNQNDYPLEIVFSREDYDLITQKNLQTWPQYVFLDAAWPLGNVYFYPVPPGGGGYSMHLTLKAILSQFTSLVQSIILPPEYFAALEYNMARRLRASFRLPPDAEINALAKDALNVIRKANAQIPRLQMPEGLIRPAYYNALSDQSY